jgi:Spy/CpxP family protein refolding chaperone
MLRVGVTSLVFVLVATLAASAQPPAQDRPLRLGQTMYVGDGLFSGTYTLISLMNNPDVQKELELTDEQEAKLKDLQKQSRQAREKIEGEFLENRKKLQAEGKFQESNELEIPRRVAFTEIENNGDDALTRKILDSRQLARLQEIRLRAEGSAAFKRPEVKERLGLSPEQVAVIGSVALEGVKLINQVSVLPPDAKPTKLGGEETPESKAFAVVATTIKFRMAEARLSTMKAVESLLTNEQHLAYLTMIGEPFQFLKLPTGPPYRVLAQDKGKVAIVDPAGKIEWEIPLRHTAHDIQLLPNGNILIPTDNVTIIEMTPEKRIVWKHVSKAREPYKGAVEIHAFQRLPDGLTMVAETGNKRIIEVDAEDKVVKEIPLVVDKPDSHRDTRRVRKLANGHYLACHEKDATVREYDEAGKVVWSYKLDLAGRPATPGHEGHGTEVFNAIRRPDGNTIIAGGNNNRVFEVNPEGKVVWSVDHDELPGIELHWVTSLQLKPNGNLIFGNTHAGPKNPQLIEVTRDKKVVWTFHDFKTFGNDLCASQVINVEEGVVR